MAAQAIMVMLFIRVGSKGRGSNPSLIVGSFRFPLFDQKSSVSFNAAAENNGLIAYPNPNATASMINENKTNERKHLNKYYTHYTNRNNRSET